MTGNLLANPVDEAAILGMTRYMGRSSGAAPEENETEKCNKDRFSIAVPSKRTSGPVEAMRRVTTTVAAGITTLEEATPGDINATSAITGLVIEEVYIPWLLKNVNSSKRRRKVET